MVALRNQIVAAHYELFGNFLKKAKFLQLSDGDNYNNIGLYELVRRKCKVIVATDAGYNAENFFADLQAFLLRMEQDFGVTIEISDEDFSRAVPRPADETKYPKRVERTKASPSGESTIEIGRTRTPRKTKCSTVIS